MSYKKGDEIHIDDEEATGASKEGVVRWVLLVSLLAAILILSIIWIAGAWQAGNDEPYVSPEPVEAPAAAEPVGALPE